MQIAGGLQTPRLAGCGATSPLFFFLHPCWRKAAGGALRERGALPYLIPRLPGTAQGSLTHSLFARCHDAKREGAAGVHGALKTRAKEFRLMHVNGTDSAGSML